MLCFIFCLSVCVCIRNGDLKLSCGRNCDYCKCIGNGVGTGTVTTGNGVGMGTVSVGMGMGMGMKF